MTQDKRSWAVVLTGICAFLDMYCAQTMLPQVQAAFSASVQQVILTVTAATVGMAVAAPIAGLISDRYGRRRVLLTATALLCVATLGAATAPTLDSLIGWRLLQGLLVPGISTSIIAYVAEEWPADQAGMLAGYYTAGTVLGGVAGRFIGGQMSALAGWRSAYLVLGLLTALAAWWIARHLPASSRPPLRRSVGESLAGFGSLLRNPALLATCAIGFAMLFGHVAAFTYMNLYLSQPPFNLDSDALSWLSLVFLAALVSSPLGSRLAQRLGRRRVAAGAFVLSAAAFALTLFGGLPLAVLGLALGCSSLFAIQSLSASLVPQLAPHARSTAVGIYTGIYYVGGSAGAALPAQLWESHGWAGCVALIGGVQLLAALLVLRAWRTQRTHPAPSPVGVSAA